MFGLFKSSPLKKWQKDYESLLTRGFRAKRNGNIRLYSMLTAEAEALKIRIESQYKDKAA